MTISSLPRVLLIAGGAAWLGVSLATVLQATDRERLWMWMPASVLFIGCVAWNARGHVPSLPGLALQSASVVAMSSLLCNGYEGLLLVFIAAQLALRGSYALSLTWIAVQTAALAVAISVHWAPQAALMLLPPYLGFQVLMYVALKLFVDERRTSERLAEAHASLVRLQARLAQRTRGEERSRIAQEMHDVLGHHLAALSLNLEIAAHQSEDAGRKTIRTAQSLARELLSDVKTLVRDTGDETPVDLQREMKQLATELPRPRLHVTFAPDLRGLDPRTGRALFRVVQEVVTNAIRHGHAQNLWIAVEQTNERVRLIARDDGEAGAYFVEGFGLSGMRRRLEELGGTLSAARTAEGGFEVRAELPCRDCEAA